MLGIGQVYGGAVNLPQTPEAEAMWIACAHDKPWKDPCPECDRIWRADCVARLEKQAAKLGFRLVPIDETKT